LNMIDSQFTLTVNLLCMQDGLTKNQNIKFRNIVLTKGQTLYYNARFNFREY
jgi:hypothetical protein